MLPVSRKTLGLLLLLCLFGAAHAHAGEWISKTYARYEEAQTFKRIREYLTGKEYMGDRIIVRAPEQERAGFYWVVRLSHPANKLPEGAQLRVTFFREATGARESRTFALPTNRRVWTIYAGVTGQDWPDSKKHPTAWQVELLDKDNNVIDHDESFLWACPAK